MEEKLVGSTPYILESWDSEVDEASQGAVNTPNSSRYNQVLTVKVHNLIDLIYNSKKKKKSTMLYSFQNFGNGIFLRTSIAIFINTWRHEQLISWVMFLGDKSDGIFICAAGLLTLLSNI